MRQLKLLVAVLAVGLALTACGSDDKDTDTAASDDATTTSAAGGTSTSAPAATADATVKVADNGGTKILVAANGHTLYLFEKDTGTTSACKTAPCNGVWPALTATGTPTAGDGVDADKLSTADGQVPNQVTYNGHLLYFFAPDKNPGDTGGTKVPSWYAVSPDGEKIDSD